MQPSVTLSQKDIARLSKAVDRLAVLTAMLSGNSQPKRKRRRLLPKAQTVKPVRKRRTRTEPIEVSAE